MGKFSEIFKTAKNTIKQTYRQKRDSFYGWEDTEPEQEEVEQKNPEPDETTEQRLLKGSYGYHPGFFLYYCKEVDVENKNGDDSDNTKELRVDFNINHAYQAMSRDLWSMLSCSWFDDTHESQFRKEKYKRLLTLSALFNTKDTFVWKNGVSTIKTWENVVYDKMISLLNSYRNYNDDKVTKSYVLQFYDVIYNLFPNIKKVLDIRRKQYTEDGADSFQVRKMKPLFENDEPSALQAERYKNILSNLMEKNLQCEQMDNKDLQAIISFSNAFIINPSLTLKNGGNLNNWKRIVEKKIDEWLDNIPADQLRNYTLCYLKFLCQIEPQKKPWYRQQALKAGIIENKK